MPNIPDQAGSIKPEDIKKLLIINLGGIGDILLSTPALRAIRTKYPNARISLLAVPRVNEVAKDIPFIDKTWLLDVERPIGRSWGNLKTVAALRREGFDLAVNMRTLVSAIGAMKMRLLLKIINPGIMAGRNTDGRGSFFDIKIDETGPGEKYEMEYDIELAGALGAQTPDRDISFQVSEEDFMKARNLLEAGGISPDDLTVGINLGGKPSHKWPLENFIRVIEGINKRVKCKFVITGDDRDEGMVDVIRAKTGLNVTSAVNRLNIKELGALLKMCRLYITNDTGPMHIAALLKTPLVAIFGPGYVRRFDPRNISRQAAVLYKETDCAPCNRVVCRKRECLKRILPEEVIDASLRFLIAGNP